MSRIFTWLKGLIVEQSYHDCVERYVASKHPTSAGEVEYWIRQFDYHTRNGGWA
jgi:hypothetical protein